MNNILKPTISVYQGIALYVGAVLGSGILILPGMTGGIAGQYALIPWIVMVLLSVPLALTFALLSIDSPSSGGVSTFAGKAFGYNAGAVVGWFFFIAGSFGQIIVSLTGGTYIAYAFQLHPAIAHIIAGFLLLISIISNYFGLKTSGYMQLVIASLTFIILAITIITSLPLISLNQFKFSFNSVHYHSYMQCILLIFWSFFGWEAISSLAPEFKNPKKRNIILSTIGALFIVGILYIGVALSVIGTNSYSNGSDAVSKSINYASLTEVVSKSLGINGSWGTGFLAFIICLGTMNAFVASMSRLGYSLAKEGMAPSTLSVLNKKNKTPTHSLLLVGAIAAIGLLSSFLFQIDLEKLVIIPNSLGISTYIIGSAAGIKLIKPYYGKFLAIISLTTCLIAYFYIGSYLFLPLAITIACLLFIHLKKKNGAKY